MDTITIRSFYPCHKHKQVRLKFTLDLVPVQKFDRKCPVCNLDWTITARQIARHKSYIVNALDWEIYE